jgi:PPP family 3-phenylpropionic acid transporter
VTAESVSSSIDLTQKRGLLTVKILYFLVFAALGAFFPFINIYYFGIGLSGTQIGLINTVAPLVGAVSAVVWGMVNDRIGRIRLMLSLIFAGVVGMVLVLSRAGFFWQILPAAAMMSLFSSPLFSLLNATTIRLLGHRSDEYGSYRIWGTYGFIITSSLTGFILNRHGMIWIFWLYAGSMILCLFTAQWLPSQKPAQYGVSITKGMQVLIRNPRWLVFASSVFLTWFAAMGSMVFVGVTMKQMGAATQLIGLASTISAVAEIPYAVLHIAAEPICGDAVSRLGAGD